MKVVITFNGVDNMGGEGGSGLGVDEIENIWWSFRLLKLSYIHNQVYRRSRGRGGAVLASGELVDGQHCFHGLMHI